MGKVHMFFMRSGECKEDANAEDQTPIENEGKKVEIDKNKLIETLIEMKELKQSDLSAFESSNEQELETILLKLALMKVGFVPGNDNSVKVFYETLACYESDNEIKAYLPFVLKEIK
jgi:hypothetical protein